MDAYAAACVALFVKAAGTSLTQAVVRVRRREFTAPEDARLLRTAPQPPRSPARVIARYPRTGFKRTWAARMDQEAAAQPRSRLAFLYGRGFRGMILRAPFAE